MHIYELLFKEFLSSDDTLRVYEGEQLIFSSPDDGLLPLLQYLDHFPASQGEVVVFDKIVGNAAALLSIEAGCKEVFSPLGSQSAIKTLNEHGIKHHVTEIVEYILRADGKDMCPMEKLSLGKSPAEFYEVVSSAIRII